jgi:carboxyl-terminal processing protease
MRRSLKLSGILLFVWISAGIVRGDSPPEAAQSPQPQTPQPQTIAAVEELKTEAFKAIRTGDFDRSSSLLAQAAAMTQDPQVQLMADWAAKYDGQCKTFATERHQEFEKAVARIHLLLDHKMDSYAIDEAAQAYLFADDKTEFRKEKWIDDLVQESATSADQAEQSEDWLKALRLYSDLCSLEPTNGNWRDQFDAAMRRVSLLMVYAPDQLKKIQDSESKDRKAADDLLYPTTRPTTDPSVAAAATQPDDLASDSGDWREATKGVQYDMLWDSLVLAEQQYYRDVTFQDLLEGGLTGLQMIVTTRGLEATFPGLADNDKRQEFLNAINGCMADAKAATDDNAEDVLTQSLNHLRDLNEKTVQIPEEVFVSQFADGAFADLDPFSKVVWPSEVEETEKMTQGEFGGVGLEIQNDGLGNLKVETPLPDTPAYRSGIQAGDIIARIDGKSAKNVPVEKAVKIIIGVPGTSVTLTIRSPDGTEKDHLLRREMIKVDSVEGDARKPGGDWDYMIDPEQKIAYIRLTSFSKSTSDDLDKAMDDVKSHGARAVILDLRDNLGGLLPAATAVVNKFVSDGVIVRTQADRLTSNPPIVIDARPKDTETDVPMVVLVNQWSASASEIVSGSLKDHHRALIVGERTYGKGSVQMLYPLDGDKAYLKLTTAHYYLPSGRCIHREKNSLTWGVDPDVTVEMTPQQMQSVIDVRNSLGILRDADAQTQPSATTRPGKSELLQADSQLAAGVLLLRLELAGAQI